MVELISLTWHRLSPAGWKVHGRCGWGWMLFCIVILMSRGGHMKADRKLTIMVSSPVY
jgi:hypothetical protein